MKEGLPLPKRIQNAPELLPGLEFYMSAFYDLDTTRPVGFELGPISWLAINEYGHELGLDREEREDLQYLIRMLDNEFLMYHRKKSSKGGEKIGKSK